MDDLLRSNRNLCTELPAGLLPLVALQSPTTQPWRLNHGFGNELQSDPGHASHNLRGEARFSFQEKGCKVIQAASATNLPCKSKTVIQKGSWLDEGSY